MTAFLLRHTACVLGILSGFDRLVFRGTLRQLCRVEGMDLYLTMAGVLLKDFKAHVQKKTKELCEASLRAAREQDRPVRYLSSPSISKEDLAREIAEEDGISDGLICVFKSVELCHTFEVSRDPQQKKLVLRPRLGKCSHLYHYYMHPAFGFMSARIQTWFPFRVQVCINGPGLCPSVLSVLTHLVTAGRRTSRHCGAGNRKSLICKGVMAMSGLLLNLLRDRESGT